VLKFCEQFFFSLDRFLKFKIILEYIFDFMFKKIIELFVFL